MERRSDRPRILAKNVSFRVLSHQKMTAQGGTCGLGSDWSGCC